MAHRDANRDDRRVVVQHLTREQRHVLGRRAASELWQPLGDAADSTEPRILETIDRETAVQAQTMIDVLASGGWDPRVGREGSVTVDAVLVGLLRGWREDAEECLADDEQYLATRDPSEPRVLPRGRHRRPRREVRGAQAP